MSDDFFNEPQYSEKTNSGSNVWILAVAVIFILIFVCCMLFTHSVATPPNPKVMECKKNIENLGNALLSYTNKHNGIIPGIEIDGKPYWKIIEDNNENEASDISKKLKCYSDTTDDPTSYILNESLSGKSLDSIPESEYSKTALIYEHPTGKYHRWAFYLDGIVRQYK